MKTLPRARHARSLALPSRKSLLRGLVLGGLTLLATHQAGGRPLAQAQALDGPGFVLARDAVLTRDEREFHQADTLHMWVRGPLAKGEITPTGWWRLEGPTQSFAGELSPLDGGLVAELELAASEPADGWTWSASVEWKGQLVASPIAALRIRSSAPQAGLATSVSVGEAPLRVAFEDRSQGEVTSWSWDFGDGQGSSERNPAHVYSAPGEFAVTLTTGGPFGESTATLADPLVVEEQDLVIRYGMNASENVWWQRGIAFSDAMARASEFNLIVNGTIGRVPAPLIPLGEDPPCLGAGWPDLTQLAPEEKVGVRLFGSMGGTMPDGRGEPYVLTWNGTGSCRLDGLAVLGEANRGANRVEVFLDPSAGEGDALLTWVVDASDPLDPVRDAHVWLPGMEQEQSLLWPPFVEKLHAMNDGRGPVSWRGMDWSEVNQYGRTGGAAPFVFDFAGRITPASPSQGTKRGVAVEYQVALCNAVGSGLHLCVPHAASEISDADYELFLRDVFLRMRDGSPAVPGMNGGRPFAPLARHLRLTLEFSNEVWNPSFPVNAWIRARAQANGRTFPQQVAREIERVFAVAESVFTGPDAARLQRFVGGWLGDPSYLLEVLSALDPAVHVDAVGPAVYFGPRRQNVEAWMMDAEPGSCPNCPAPEDIVQSARLRIGELDLRLLEHQLIAAARTNPDGSLPRLELYEGGASFDAGFQPWGSAASQAQRIPAMYEAYVQDLVPELIARGVDVVNWYSFMFDGNAQGTAGPFGHWESMDQTITLPVPDEYVDEGAPKAAAIYKLPPRR
jgi:PKD repeat protein